MGTIWVREFRGGLDTRRLPETSPGGTLMRARDCHINRGGEIEQRADFVPTYTLPDALTKGMAASTTGLVVFGHQTAPTLPAGVGYLRLQHPSGEALASVHDTRLYNGVVQSIGAFADGSRYVFHGETRVSDASAPPNLANSANPAALLTAASKLFIAAGPALFFSAVNDSTDFGAGGGTGDGFIVMATHDAGSADLTGLAIYDQYVAVFSRKTIQIWFFDPDPDLSRKNQVLKGTGTLANRSITEFGDGDVFYLDSSGIRSLRARDSSNSAATTDIGSPIDTEVADYLATVGAAAASTAIGIIEPRDGRFWLAVRNRIYVFSYFAASKVSAWTEYRPGFQVDDMVVYEDRVWLRAGDTIHVYGGTGEELTYSSATRPEVWLPFLDADKPFTAKHLTGIDAAVRGTWEVRLAMDPTDQSASDLVARIDDTTYGINRIDAPGDFNHISLRLVCTAPRSDVKPAVFSSTVIHFTTDEADDS